MSKSIVILFDASTTKDRIFDWKYILQKLDYSTDISGATLTDIVSLDDIKALDVSVAYNTAVDMLTIAGLSLSQCNSIYSDHIPQLKTAIDHGACLFFTPPRDDSGESIDCINLISSDKDNIHFKYDSGKFIAIEIDEIDLVGSDS